MNQIKIPCSCGEKFSEEDFEKHYYSCQAFKLQFKLFDAKFGELIKAYSEPRETLLVIKFLLKQYINVIDKRLKKFFRDLDKTPSTIENKENNFPLCQRCKVNSDIIYLTCVHPICQNCFIKYAEESFYDMKCNICQYKIDDEYKKIVLGDKKMEELEEVIVYQTYENLVKCPNCGKNNYFEASIVDYNIRDKQNQLLSKAAAENYAKYRCKCAFCKIDFCINKGCNKAMPYHLGFTCEVVTCSPKPKICKYCDSQIKVSNAGPCDDVCNDTECIERYDISCKKLLPCGHKCFGVNGELKCPPCIDNECKSYGGQYGQQKYDYCTICYTEGLSSSPIVSLTCGHYFHYFCVKERLEKKWIGPKITFNFCMCELCNKLFDCETLPDLQKIIDENKKLYKEIKDMSLKRLKFEDLDKDPRLSDPQSPWFGKKEEFAMKSLSYYMCYICNKPYFAGIKECGNDPDMDNYEPNLKFNPKDCVCGKDSNLSGVAGETNCKKHGKDFIEYKCKFCCKYASWFCWGTTHICDDCYRLQNNIHDLNKFPKDRLSKCDKDKCEVGGNHPPNGEEFALGCSICRNEEKNEKESKINN